MTALVHMPAIESSAGQGQRIDKAEPAAAAFLARYQGRTLDAYRYDLRAFFQWAADEGLVALSATRPHVEPTSEPWRLGAWRRPPWTGGFPPSAASTASPTSMAGSPPTRRSTSAGPRSTPMTPAALTARLRAGPPDTAHRRQGQQAGSHPLVPRTARTIDLAIGERTAGPILLRQDGSRLDRRTAHRWLRSIAKRAGLGHVNPHMLRAAFIMCALEAGVPLREVQIAARHADPRTTTVYTTAGRASTGTRRTSWSHSWRADELMAG